MILAIATSVATNLQEGKQAVLHSQEAHVSKLKEGVDAGGDASLQNGLDLAVASLKSVPPYGHREVCACSKNIPM